MDTDLTYFTSLLTLLCLVRYVVEDDEADDYGKKM